MAITATATAPAAPVSAAQPAAGTPNAPTPESKSAAAEEQLKTQEKQRILGIVPNFNTSYNKNAPPLSPRQKLRLAWRSAIDPATFTISALDAGLNMAQDSFPEYGWGAGGYGKYLGASYVDTFDGTMIGNAFFPILLKQDPRYFRMGEGHSFKRRLFYAISTTVWCKNDNGKWGPNYSNVLGNLAAGGISNLYYPKADRGAELTIERGLTVTAEGTIGGVFVEFWPDVARKFLRGRLAKGIPPPANQPPASQ